MTLHVDERLAARLESHVAGDFRAFAQAARERFPDEPAALLELGGGVALYLGDGSPMNEATGLGLAGPVANEVVVELERFYRERGAEPLVLLNPLADRSLVSTLMDRGWRLAGFENTFGLELDSPAAARVESWLEEARADSGGRGGRIEVAEAVTDDERDLWARVNMDGFVAPSMPEPAFRRLAELMAARDDMRLYVALVDGKPAGSAALRVVDGVAWLLADATLPEFRGRGVQRRLQLERLAAACRQGCELSVTEALPSTPSMRNIERLGFSLLYTLLDVSGPLRK